MELSMWMIAQALSDYPCRSCITRGRPEIRGVRFLSQVEFPDDENVYVESWPLRNGADPLQAIRFTHRGDTLTVEARDQQTVLNRVLGLFDRLGRWESMAAEAEARADSPQALLDLAGELLPVRGWVVERGGRICASIRGSSGAEDLIYQADGRQCMRSEHLRQLSLRGAGRVGRCAFLVPELGLSCRDLYDGGNRVGELLLETGDVFDSCLLQFSELLGGQLERWLERHPDRAVLSRSGSVLQQLLTPDPDPACVADFDKYLRSQGWQREDRKVLYLAEARDGPVSARIDGAEAAFAASIVTEYGRQMVLLVNHAVSGDAAVELALGRIAARGCSIGASYSFTRLEETYQALQQARLALGRESGVHRCSEALPAYISELVRTQTTMDLSHPALAALEDYDARHHTQLLETLMRYLLLERNQKLTAETLSIHRNSLCYRLEKIQTLCSLDLEDPDVRLRLLLSFLLRWHGRIPPAGNRDLPSAAT